MLMFMRKNLTHALRSNLVKTSLNYCGCVSFIDDTMSLQQKCVTLKHTHVRVWELPPPCLAISFIARCACRILVVSDWCVCEEDTSDV